MADGCSQRTLYAPSASEPRIKRSSGYSKLFCPILEDHGFPLICDSDIATVMSRLFSPCCPHTVVGTVITVIIQAINSMLRGWPRPHICEKVRKTISAKPSLADADTTPAIVLIRNVIRIATTLSHSAPRRELRSAGLSMSSMPFCRGLTPKTTAASRTAANKAGRQDGGCVAARAFALPIRAHSPAHTPSDAMYKGQSTEYSTDKIQASHVSPLPLADVELD